MELNIKLLKEIHWVISKAIDRNGIIYTLSDKDKTGR